MGGGISASSRIGLRVDGADTCDGDALMPMTVQCNQPSDIGGHQPTDHMAISKGFCGLSRSLFGGGPYDKVDFRSTDQAVGELDGASGHADTE
jgi:hypothetical protein